jgi:hypothetical protein
MLHLPIPLIMAELGALVPSIEGSTLRLHSTSLAFWEGDCPLAQDHYKILWVAIMKVTKRRAVSPDDFGKIQLQGWCHKSHC